MNNQKLNELVGKSFEDLSVEEMQELQGASSVEINSTPATPSIVYISTVEVSEAISTLISAVSVSVVSYIASKQRKCT
ncbi:MAG: lichenicidin A2 family type 2 lantibiotic [Lachnotalea sp.]